MAVKCRYQTKGWFGVHRMTRPMHVRSYGRARGHDMSQELRLTADHTLDIRVLRSGTDAERLLLG